jgi:hypothetical protein
MANHSTNVDMLRFQLQQVESRLLVEPDNMTLINLSVKIKRLIELSLNTECENQEKARKFSKTEVPKNFTKLNDSNDTYDVEYLKNAKIGDDCEVLDDNTGSEISIKSIWRHAIIRDISPGARSAAILFTDTGEIAEVSASSIRYFDPSKKLKLPHNSLFSSMNKKDPIIGDSRPSKKNNQFSSFKKISRISKKDTLQSESQKSWLEFSKKLSKK